MFVVGFDFDGRRQLAVQCNQNHTRSHIARLAALA
jgi:hypothetical protein